MRALDLIIAKRSGAEHSLSELQYLVNGVLDGSIPDYQVSAWLMSVLWQGMTVTETAHLTDLMARSGRILDLSSVGPIVLDKHSTGGVGDKTTLVFLPLLAAAGLPTGMLSGRGLGHTGGTLDKLEAIPGFQTQLSSDRFIWQLKEIGMAISGQTADLAPVDGKLYALRDVTGTVESIPLICASVLSKKIAGGANLIVLDVKVGSGAFMVSEENALKMAQYLTEVGKVLNKPVVAVVTDMDQPLGQAVGHTVEVIEAIECLKGRGPADLRELCLVLGSLALVHAKKAKDDQEARAILSKLLDNGEALKKFEELISAQGGDIGVLEDYSLMPQARLTTEFLGQHNAHHWVKSINGRKIAQACNVMGAGRDRKGDPIDLAVGLHLNVKVGDKLSAGQPLARIYAESEDQYRQAAALVNEAFGYSEEPVLQSKLVKAQVG